MTRRWKASRLIYRVDKGTIPLGDCPRDCMRDWRGRRRRQGKGMREEGHRILRKKLSDPAPYQRRWNAHGEVEALGIAQIESSLLLLQGEKRAAAEKQYVWRPSARSRLQEWLLGRRGGGDRKALGMRNGVLDVVFRKTKRARTMAERIGARASRKGRGIICRLPSRIGED